MTDKTEAETKVSDDTAAADPKVKKPAKLKAVCPKRGKLTRFGNSQFYIK